LQPLDPKAWRDKAAEARALAETMHNQRAIEAMLKAALEYERLAAVAEGLLRNVARGRIP